MWTHKDSMNSTPRGFPFSTPQPEKKRSNFSNAISTPPCQNRPSPLPERKYTPPQSNNNNLFHIIHKVPAGDSPYVRAKHVQLVDNNPSKAVSLFWAAINSGDRVDSALKDMAVVMKQLNRSDEAIEAIKSFRHLCPHDAQDSLDNILLELYKRSGRIEEQILLLQLKLKRIEEATSIDGNRTKLARSQGKKIQITIGQEYSRLLGNLAWAHLQQDSYKLAEEIYRKALSLDQDKNKRCNLAICLMYMGNMTEAKFLLSTVKVSNRNRDLEEESYAKSYDRAIQVMNELEMEKKGCTGNPLSFSLFLSRNKETDSSEISTKGKRGDSDPGSKRSYGSPCTVSSTPRVPFTQPKRRDWVRPESGAGCLRKLQFEKGPELKSEMSVMPLMEPQSLSKVVTDAGNKKSWADMVEEDEQSMLETSNVNDEQILFESSSCYGDENEDCNIMNGKFNTLGVRDGYQSQPGTATCRRSQMVKRSLTFDKSQSANEDENYWYSSPVQKENMGYESSDCANGRF